MPDEESQMLNLETGYCEKMNRQMASRNKILLSRVQAITIAS